jgi:hypothetical protein
MNDREQLADSRFLCSRRERAAFEAGIKMATIYHQFVGTPVDIDSVAHLEETIARSIEVQPYVSSCTVTIDRSRFVRNVDTYSYHSLTGDMIDAVVVIDIEGVKVRAEMRYDEELRYPLMYISDIS